MSQNGNVAPRDEGHEATFRVPALAPQDTRQIEIFVPLCYAGIGPAPCGDEAYCLTRNQPMCGGHCLVEPGSPEGRAYLRAHNVMVGPKREVDRG